MNEANDTLKVMAAHDDPVLLGGIDRVLGTMKLDLPEASLGMTCRTVPLDGPHALADAVRAHAPDILVMDMALSGDRGLERFKELEGAEGDMLTLMLMADASLRTAADATRQGVFDVLPKPFTPADLRDAIRRAASRILLTRRARRLEEEKRQVRFDFIRVLGHELKAPLGAVATNIGVIKGHYLGGEIGSYDELLNRCDLRLDQMHKLIVDLLDMTRLESGRKRRDLAEVNVSAVARDAIELASPQAEQRRIELHLDAPDSLPFVADRGELDMIFNNLISNAVKYNRDEGDVFVSVSGDRTGIVLKVRDTGIGMAPEDVKKLFGEFVRIKNKKTANILGSGLGLSILKRLTELYNGRVEVESVPDAGSTFTVHLPSAKTGNGENRGEPQ